MSASLYKGGRADIQLSLAQIRARIYSKWIAEHSEHKNPPRFQPGRYLSTATVILGPRPPAAQRNPGARGVPSNGSLAP